jgi:uncharacterized protein (DUF362 family)
MIFNFLNKAIGRRSFIGGSLKLSTAAFVGGILPVDGLLSFVPKSTISVVKGQNKRNITIDAIDAVGGIGRFITGGERVVVKPNIGWDRTPELGANTHPDVVKTIVEMCLDAGAKEVSVFDRTCHDARRTYESSGIKGAIEGIRDSRAKIKYVDSKRFVSLDIPRGKKLTTWEFYRDVLDADTFINVPVAKTHGASTLTLSMKNLMGIIGGNRATIHWSIDQKLADISSLIKPDLIVLDATRIMVKGGPTGGSIENVTVKNTVVAGTDPVAVDSYGATLFGMRGRDIGHISAAYEMGLGEIDLSNVKIIGG